MQDEIHSENTRLLKRPFDLSYSKKFFSSLPGTPPKNLQAIIDISKFQKKITNLIPKINNLALTKKEWEQLTRTMQGKRCFSRDIFEVIAQMRNQDVNHIIQKITKPSLPRAVKVVPTKKTNTSFLNLRLKRTSRTEKLFFQPSKDIKPDVLDMMKNIQNIYFEKFDFGSPDKHNCKLRKTSSNFKSHGYRIIFKNINGMLAKLLTPEGTKEQQGQMSINRAPKLDLNIDINLECSDKIEFCATKEKMENRIGVMRHKTQNQLTKISCSNFFSIQGCDVQLGIKSRDYHWCHLIAFFLGGDQKTSNLIAGTAASNYYVLELIEKHVAKLLSKGVKDINIEVSIKYQPNSLIPRELKYILNGNEKIYINPLSHRKLTDTETVAVNVLRGQGLG